MCIAHGSFRFHSDITANDCALRSVQFSSIVFAEHAKRVFYSIRCLIMPTEYRNPVQRNSS